MKRKGREGIHAYLFDDDADADAFERN